MRIGLLTKKSPEKLDLLALPVIGATLICFVLFVLLTGPDFFIGVPLALILVAGGLALVIFPVRIVYRKNSAFGRGYWGYRVFDGLLWDSEQDAWLSGAIRIKVGRKVKTFSHNVKVALDVSPHLDSTSPVQPSRPLELKVCFFAP